MNSLVEECAGCVDDIAHDRMLSASVFCASPRSGRVSLSFFSSRSLAALLAEAERLGKERVDVQRQAEKDHVGLAGRLRHLELALEEHESRAQQQEEQHRTQTEDLQQHISALEKQLKHHRQFIDVSTRNTNVAFTEIHTAPMCVYAERPVLNSLREPLP